MEWWRRGQRSLEDFVRRHGGVVLLLGALFVIGVVFGALAVGSLDPRSKQEMVRYLGESLSGLSRGGPAPAEGSLMLKAALLRSLKYLVLLWVLGISLVGVLGVAALALLRGFVSGFTEGFLAAELGWRGVALAVAGHLPQSLLEVPALVIGGTAAVAFSLQVIRSWSERRRVPQFYPALARLTGTLLATGLVLVVAGLVESYLSPALVRFAASFLQPL
jgi:stage II sporulation protein M